MAETKRNVVLGPGRMLLAEHERLTWAANAPEGTTKADLERSDFWALFAAQLQPFHRVEVRANDSTWLADCVVLAAGNTWAKVSVLAWYSLDKESVLNTAQYTVQFKGPHDKWAVVRYSDNAVIKKGLRTRDEAALYMLQHEREVK